MITRSRSAVALATFVLAASSCALPHPMERMGLGARPCELDQLPAEAGAYFGAPDPLVWYRTGTERDRELAAQWCATAGPPLLRLQPEPTGATWQAEPPLHVLSWNTWMGGGDILTLLAEEIGVSCGPGRAAPADADPFVLLLQEVWRYSAELPEVEASRVVPFTIDPGRPGPEGPDIDDVARLCGLSLVYVPSARNGPDNGSRPNEDKGNAILSNLPLRNPMAFDLPLEGGRKVAVGATVVGPAGERIRVVSVHLDVTSTLVRLVTSGNQTRVRQAMGLIEGLELAEAEGHVVDATVVGADMNTWASNEASLKRMREAFPESPESDGLSTRWVFPTDHMFFRVDDGVALSVDGYERIEDTYSSDHHARQLFVVSRSAD